MRPLRVARGTRPASRYFWMPFLFCFLSAPALAYADTMIPMLFLTFPSMLVALVPIIFIEAAVYSRLLRIKYQRTVVSSAAANLASTIVGIPLAWVINLIVNVGVVWLLVGFSKLGIATNWEHGFSGDVMSVVFSSALLMPAARDEVYRWYPIGAMIGLIPAFFISVVIEALIVHRFFNEADADEISDAVCKANQLTYVLLFIVLMIFLYCTVNIPGYSNRVLEGVAQLFWFLFHPR